MIRSSVRYQGVTMLAASEFEFKQRFYYRCVSSVSRS